MSDWRSQNGKQTQILTNDRLKNDDDLRIYLITSKNFLMATFGITEKNEKDPKMFFFSPFRHQFRKTCAHDKQDKL